jgi:hypothetical protein
MSDTVRIQYGHASRMRRQRGGSIAALKTLLIAIGLITLWVGLQTI